MRCLFFMILTVLLLVACAPIEHPVHSQPMEEIILNEPTVKIIAPSDFTEDLLVAKAKSYISSGSAVKIDWIVTSEKYHRCAYGPGTTDSTYENFVIERGKCLGSYDIARIVQFGSTASIQVRFSDGRRLERVLGKSNPLMIDAIGFRIAHLAFLTVNANSKVGPKDTVFVYVDLVPLTPEVLTARTNWGSIYQILVDYFGTYSISVQARSDYLFQSQVPFAYPFSDLEKTPSWEDYSKRGGVLCLAIKSNLECTQGFPGGVSTDRSFPIQFKQKK